MSLLRVLGAVLLRAGALVAVTAVCAFVLGRSETTDALGAGLLVFLILATVAFVWGLVDGVRSGLTGAFVVWLLASAVAGCGIPVVLTLTAVTEEGVAQAIRDGAVFFALLVLLPATFGVGIGALVHRVRGRPTSPGTAAGAR